MREPKVRQVIAESKTEVFVTDILDSKWNTMKETWQNAAEEVRERTKGLPRHSET